MNSKIKILGKCIELPFKITFKRFIILTITIVLLVPVFFIKRCTIDIDSRKIEYEKQNIMRKK